MSPGSDSGQLAIVTTGLHKTYRGGLVAVDRLDLAVRRGEIFGLLGPNGAGKTTTIGMLTTRVVPSAGRGLVAGVDVHAHPARAKRHIGVVPQTNTLDRSLTVAENLEFHGRYFGLRGPVLHARTAELLEQFRLGDRGETKVDTLSGGMAQRLMVARAVMHHPDVLFLDEPTSGLDPQSRIALWELLGQLHREGQTILLTTHYMEEAERLCDRVAIMDQGRMLACDTPARLKDTVDAETVVHLGLQDGDAAALAGHLSGMEGVVRVDVHDGGVRVVAATARGLLPRLIVRAEQQHMAVVDVDVSEPTLETVFIALTGRDLRE